LDFIGLATFTYRISDGLATSNPTTVTIGVGLDAPVASDDAYATFRNQVLAVEADAGVLVNDVDPEAEPLVAVLVDDASAGTLVLAADGSFTYEPDAGSVGTDTFTYVASNGEAVSVVATVTITVTNRPPVASPNAYPMFRNGTLTVPAATGVLDDDTDPDGDPLTAVLVTPPASGTLTLAADGGFTYTPPAGDTGPVTFTYVADDGIDESAPATVTITVTNRPPVAVNDGPYATFRNQPLTVPAGTGVLANDTDPDGDPLTVTAVTQPTGGAGTVTVNANGGFTYTPTTGYTGTTTFTYTAGDGLATDTANVTINVTNRAPIANPDAYSMFRNGTLTTTTANDVLTNDTDPDGDPLTVTLGTDVANGVLDLQPDGSFTYTPDLDFFGNDTFTYTASDGELSSAPATVTITVTPVNDAPVAVDDAYATAFETELVVPAPGVLENDTDPDGDTLTVTLDTDVANGTLNLQPDGSFTYTPDAAFSGEDTFTYTASDGVLSSAPATVTITVAAEE
jgi:VCBS repeat-containing protein